MAKPRQPARAPRCAYIERGQRCRRAGTGNPPLCEAHRIVIEAEAARPARPGERLVGLIGRAFRGQKITDESIYSGIEDLVGMFSQPPGSPHDPVAAARARAAEFIRRAKAEGFPPPRPRKPKPPPGPDPRIVLGFASGQKLTKDEVKRRHRELARRHHPDRGGSVAKMQEVNRAVAEILATL